MGTYPTGKPRINSVKGFTLLELLVVLAILLIFLGIFSLGTRRILSSDDLRLAAREIMSAIAETRGKAAATRSKQVLFFDIEKNSLEKRITKKNEDLSVDGDGRKTFLVLPKGVILEDIRVIGRGKFQDGVVAIHFFPNGCLERMLIHLKNSTDETYTIEVNPLTGQATLYESYIDQEEGI